MFERFVGLSSAGSDKPNTRLDSRLFVSRYLLVTDVEDMTAEPIANAEVGLLLHGPVFVDSTQARNQSRARVQRSGGFEKSGNVVLILSKEW